MSGKMTALLIQIAATLITLPVIVIVLSYLLQMIWSGRKRGMVKRSLDVSVPFFAAAIYFGVLEFLGLDILFWMIAVFLTSLGLLLFIHWRLFDEVDVKKSLLMAWRLHFLLYFGVYLGLLISEVIYTVMQ
ncbi:hypothetical protein Bsel_1643 [[Bacillus] selenitireducens MLS10]|uniref:DUF3397 domain-containing protein n=2 Tax=Salisediminibacterium selenitireducens TaxID=85683 RepID=D6XTL6_BACIE|nr:hypothetical protein Bsel_1643 [[Bacillus] selenitireducens MLS10]